MLEFPDNSKSSADSTAEESSVAQTEDNASKISLRFRLKAGMTTGDWISAYAGMTGGAWE